jgi:O-antigen ligase
VSARAAIFQGPVGLRARGLAATGWLAAVLAASVATALIAYHLSALDALAAVVGIGVVALVLYEPVIGIALALLLVPAETLNVSVGGAFALTPAKALFLLTGFSCGMRLLFGARSLRVHRAHVAFACFLVVLAAGLLVAVDTFVTLKILIDWGAFLCISVQASRLDSRRGLALARLLVLSAAILSAIEIATTGNQTLVDAGAAAVNRGTAAFANSNLLAFYLVLALGPAIVLATRELRPISLLYGAAAALDAVGIAFTLTRSALIAMVLVLVALLWWAPFRRIGAVVLVALLVAALLDPKVFTRSRELNIVSTRVATVEHFSSTAGDRIQIWSTAERIIADHPFIGIGEGNFPTVSSTRYGLIDVEVAPPTVYEHAHDVMLTIAAETGLFGAALFLWFVLEAAGCALAALRRLRGRPELGLVVGLAASLFGEAVVSTVDYPIGNDVVMATTLLEVGLLIALAGLQRRSGSERTASAAV